MELKYKAEKQNYMVEIKIRTFGKYYLNEKIKARNK